MPPREDLRQTKPDTPEGYVNALLTTLGKIAPKSVTITPGPGVPALAPLATDPNELEWISSLPFKYDAVDGTRVIAVILPCRLAFLAGPARPRDKRFARYRGWSVRSRSLSRRSQMAEGWAHHGHASTGDIPRARTNHLVCQVSGSVSRSRTPHHTSPHDTRR
jgi:hypothetical protein